MIIKLELFSSDFVAVLVATFGCEIQPAIQFVITNATHVSLNRIQSECFFSLIAINLDVFRSSSKYAYKYPYNIFVLTSIVKRRQTITNRHSTLEVGNKVTTPWDKDTIPKRQRTLTKKH